MDLSIIIPTYNERENLGKTITHIVPVLNKNKIKYEIIIVDDDSPDGTGKFAKKIKNKNIKVLIRTNIRGYGTAIRDGIMLSSGKFIIATSADFCDDPKDIIKLYNEIKKGYDVVYTTRFSKGGKIINYSLLKTLSNRAFNYLTSLIFLMKYKDISNGFKIYRKDLLDSINLESEGFEINPELAIKSYLKGKRFSEIGVTWIGRQSGLSKLNLVKVGPRYLKLILKLFFRRLL